MISLLLCARIIHTAFFLTKLPHLRGGARGCRLGNAFTQHAKLALVFIAELRICGIGLVDVTVFKTTGLFVAP